MVKYRRIRSEPGYRQLVDVTLERAFVQQITRDVVEPEALTEVVQHLRGFHFLPPPNVLFALSIPRAGRRSKTGSPVQ